MVPGVAGGIVRVKQRDVEHAGTHLHGSGGDEVHAAPKVAAVHHDVAGDEDDANLNGNPFRPNTYPTRACHVPHGEQRRRTALHMAGGLGGTHCCTSLHRYTTGTGGGRRGASSGHTEHAHKVHRDLAAEVGVVEHA